MDGPTLTNPIFITLGSNIDPEHNLREAVRLLAEQLAIWAVSRVYETSPLSAMGHITPGQGKFLNAAILVGTDTPPVQLKHNILRPIETRLGRVRTADKYAPRTIDLDLALYGDLTLDDPANGITIPDPDIIVRAHVALPLADLAPDFVHPVTGQTLAKIAGSFTLSPGIRLREMKLAF